MIPNGVHVTNLAEFKVTQSDFISEKKGKFRDFYSFGPVLGTGNLIIFLMFDALGGFGEVRKCSNRKSGAIRAVKIINKDTLNETDKEKFLTEIEIMRQLDHPNIVRLFEIFQDEK